MGRQCGKIGKFNRVFEPREWNPWTNRLVLAIINVLKHSQLTLVSLIRQLWSVMSDDMVQKLPHQKRCNLIIIINVIQRPIRGMKYICMTIGKPTDTQMTWYGLVGNDFNSDIRHQWGFEIPIWRYGTDSLILFMLCYLSRTLARYELYGIPHDSLGFCQHL